MNQAYQSVRKVDNCCEHFKREVTDLVTKMYVGSARCGLNWSMSRTFNHVKGPTNGVKGGN